MLTKITAGIMLLICVLAMWTGFYYLTQTGLDNSAKVILFGMPILGIILTYLYLKNKVSAVILLLPFALAYIVNAYR